MEALRPKHTLREYVALYGKQHTQFGTRLTHMIGIPMVVAAIPTAFVNPPAAAGLALGGLALQYIGHYVFEGNDPAFYSDPYYLLAGTVWAATEWLDLFGLPVPEAIRPASDPSTASAGANGEAATAAS